MAYYAYKRVRDLLPPHIIAKQEQPYEGDPGMDGDQWYAAADYIEELEAENKRLRAALVEAKEAVQSWGAYADTYFQEKWDLAGDIAAIDAALSVSDGSPQGQDAKQPDPSGRQRDPEGETPSPLSSLALGGEKKQSQYSSVEIERESTRPH